MADFKQLIVFMSGVGGWVYGFFFFSVGEQVGGWCGAYFRARPFKWAPTAESR